MNEGWTGLPIYKDNEFNKNDPEWTKAYASTDKQLGLDFGAYFIIRSVFQGFIVGVNDILEAVKNLRAEKFR